MYKLLFSKIFCGFDRIYAWAADVEKARRYLEERGLDVVRIDKCNPIEWLYHAYIKNPNKRFKKRWYKRG